MRRLSLTLLCPLLCMFAAAQMSTVPAARAIADLPGPPKNPPIFSQMTVLLQGALQYQDTVDLKGSVATVERNDEQQSSQNPNPFRTKTVLRFDAYGRLISRTSEDALGISTTTNEWESGKLKNQDVRHHRNDGRFPEWDEWQRWSYDKAGRLVRFRAGKDKEEINDYVNFKYDAKGRPLGYELYAQTLTEISYQGKHITLSEFTKYQHHKFFEQVQMLDDKGRVIEQQTDPFKVGSGDDYSPIPGRLTVEYDDEKQSGEQKFYDTDGKLVLRTKIEYDRDGVITKLRLIDPSGKERVGGETFIDEQHKATMRSGNVEWEVIYDDHGNWTERRRWFTPADGSPRIMTRLVRQVITYR